MRGDEEYVQAISMYDKDMQPFFEIEGTFTEGETTTFELHPGEQIIGVYGVFNYQPYVVGLGFILWSPKLGYETENWLGKYILFNPITKFL